jgi:DNA-binding response OmpR family regulator
VKTLRLKLGDDAEAPTWIETVRGVGYRFRERQPA